MLRPVLAGLICALAVAGHPVLAAGQSVAEPAPGGIGQAYRPEAGGGPSPVPADALRGSTAVASHAALAAAMTPRVSVPGSPTLTQQGYATPGDGGAADYDWDPTSLAPADDIFTLLPAGRAAGGPGRFVLRVPAGGLHPEVAGALGYRASQAWDGAGQPVAGYVPPDDSRAFQALSEAMARRGGGTILPSSGKLYDLGKTVLLGRHVALRCEGNPLTQTGGIVAVFTTGITHPGSAQLQVGDGATLQDCAVLRTGLAQKPLTTQAVSDAMTAWADGSQGVTLLGDDARVLGNLVVGFDTAISDVGYARPVIQQNTFDSLNGIVLDQVHDAPRIDNNHGNNSWAFNLVNHAYAAVVNSIVSPGAGFRAGTQLLTVAEGKCAVQPTLSAAVARGVVTAATIASVGDCTAFPGNPVSTTGGGGSGATFDLASQGTAYRPGIGYRFGSQAHGSEGGYASGDDAIGWGICMQVQNYFGLNLISPMCEPDPQSLSRRPTGILLKDCVTVLTIAAPYIEGWYIGMDMQQRSIAHGGSCAGVVNVLDTSVAIHGGNLGVGAKLGAAAGIRLGPYSQGEIDGLQMDTPAGIGFVAQANVLDWTITPRPTGGQAVAAMFTVDPTSIGAIKVPQPVAIGHSGIASAAFTVSGCGVVGDRRGADMAGEVLEGSGASGCTVVFATPYRQPPICIVQAAANPVPFQYAASATALVLTHAATGSAMRFGWVCSGS